MGSELSDERLQQIQQHLKAYFPGHHFTAEKLKESLENKDIITLPTEILPYLQSTLLDEKVIEVEIDGLTRVYFSRLYDDYPPLEENEEGILTEPDYNAADYLKDMQYLITLPLEPGLGNLAARRSQRILIRLFTSSYAVELGTSFQRIAEVRDVKVLRFEYPVLGMIVRGARAFRAKVPKTMDIVTRITPPKRKKFFETTIMDISAKGMGFNVDQERERTLEIDDDITIEIVIDGESMVHIKGTIRHMSKVRGKKGTERVCGVQFDLESRAIASKIERVVSQVQREHLRELSGLSEESGLELIA